VPEPECPSPGGGKERVLLVDDDQNLLESFRRLFKTEFEIFTAEGGQEALGVMDLCGPFTVIISDLKMTA